MNLQKNDLVLVTGGSGYVASWIVRYLLEDGFRVNTTVRKVNDREKNSKLTGLAREFPGQLQIFEADLLIEKSFVKAMTGCKLVIHTASPFKIQGIKNPEKELVKPALLGTGNVLETAKNISTVKRIVLTSSVVAIYGDSIEINGTPTRKFTEDEWNVTSNLDHQPYSYSKTLAEKKAWEIAGSQQQWDLVVINPGFMIGPSLSKRIDSTSVDFIKSFADGRFKFGVPDMNFGIVDVRDVAKAHIYAATNALAKGRHILVEGSYSALDLSNVLREIFDRKYPLPKSSVPKILFYLLGPLMGFSWKYIRCNVGIPLSFNNSKSINELKVKYRTLRESLKDHIEQMVKDEIIK